MPPEPRRPSSMVKTRGGIDTAKAATRRTGGTASASKKVKKSKPTAAVTEERYGKCTQHPKGGVMCVSCAMAGFTKEGYKAFVYANPRRALPRPPERRSAPAPGRC